MHEVFVSVILWRHLSGNALSLFEFMFIYFSCLLFIISDFVWFIKQYSSYIVVLVLT